MVWDPCDLGPLCFKTPSTVKLVYKDHPRDQQNIHRWSLYADSITWNYISGDLDNVVFTSINMWSLYTGGL